MKRSHVLSGLTAATLAPRFARAADATPLRIGWVATFSGGLLELAGKAADAAVAAFFKEHGDTVAGRKIEILKRDDGGVAPETAKRLAQELVVNNKVDFLMGLTVSPNAMAWRPCRLRRRYRSSSRMRVPSAFSNTIRTPPASATARRNLPIRWRAGR
jgi:branched-chain amino acid transport system substrate-binding protein